VRLHSGIKNFHSRDDKGKSKENYWHRAAFPAPDFAMEHKKAAGNPPP